ncbi:MAG TPA: response regulator transcription factor [Bacteroidetes bacterium]|nr:response regulator transcription factor [Bacteroidota bacterium]
MEQLLLLEDDQSFGYILSEYLSLKQFSVDWVRSAEEALIHLEQKSYCLAIFDIMLPGMDGFELARLSKQRFAEVPFIFLSAKSLKVDKLKGFKLGAYDYITKPVDEELLVARIRALIDQTTPNSAPVECYSIGSYTFYPAIFQLKQGGETVKLTTRESELLTLLCVNREKLTLRSKALKQIWGSNDEFSRKSMDVFVSRLRKHLAKDTSVRIENIHGKGFVLKCGDHST